MRVRLLSAMLIGLPMLFMSCSGNGDAKQATGDAAATEASDNYNPKVGLGQYTDENVKAGPLDVAMADKGKAIAESKCFSCHKLTDEKLVGPGWKGITSKHSLAWIMNFISNPDPMIDKDPELQNQLQECMVRMPNQNLSETDAREVLEFMRQNDGVK